MALIRKTCATVDAKDLSLTESASANIEKHSFYGSTRRRAWNRLRCESRPGAKIKTSRAGL